MPIFLNTGLIISSIPAMDSLLFIHLTTINFDGP